MPTISPGFGIGIELRPLGAPGTLPDVLGVHFGAGIAADRVSERLAGGSVAVMDIVRILLIVLVVVILLAVLSRIL